MLKPFNKHVTHSLVNFSVVQSKSKDDKIGSSLIESIKITDPVANPLTIEQKRSLSLCFRCGDRYFSGHKCKGKGLHIIEEEEDLVTDISVHDSSSVKICYPPDDQALITMCSSQMGSKHTTLKFKGQIGTLNVIAMLDSGSTHSFISPTIVQIMNLPLTILTPLTVVTASGTKLTTSHICGQLQFTLQNHSFLADLRLLQVTSHDIILGMDWINSYSPLTYDGLKGELCLSLKGNPVILYTKPVTA
jgi:Retroviral aspartyl protease